MDTVTAIRRLQQLSSFLDADPPEVAAALRQMLAALSPVEQRAVVRHAYWRMPEVATEALRTATGSDDRLRDLAGRGPVRGSCGRCHRVVRAHGRDDVDDDVPALCAECRLASRSGVPARRVAAPPSGFGWEFEDVPHPWRPLPLDRAPTTPRRWAEHYPEIA